MTFEKSVGLFFNKITSSKMLLPVKLIKSIDRTQESESKRQSSDVLVSGIASIP